MAMELTQLLKAVERGDHSASDRLLPLVYDELRKLATQKLAMEKPNQTLQATALVHEAYLRLVKAEPESGWEGRAHFFAAAAEAMRRILLENARRKLTRKHGGDRNRLDLDQLQPATHEIHEDLLALDDGLKRFAEKDATAAKLVKLRYFAGCTLDEAAEILKISPRTAGRLWAYAKAWLRQDIGDNTKRDRKN